MRPGNTNSGVAALVATPRRNKVILGLVGVFAGGFLALMAWPAAAPIDVRVTSCQPAEVFDDAGIEMNSVTFEVRRSARYQGGVWIEPDSTKVWVEVSGRWTEYRDPPSAGAKEMLLLLPVTSTRCRFRVRYAGASFRWRAGRALERGGIKLPPKYWAWAGWPNPQGPNPRWKECQVEIALSASGPLPAQPAAHKAVRHPMSGNEIDAKIGHWEMPLIGAFGH